MKYILIILFLAFAYTLKAQFPIDDSLIYHAKKIDMQTIKDQSYLKFANKINCDSTNGTSIEEIICANLELQKQDSLLQLELGNLINELQTVNDTVTIMKIKQTQEIWERYRYSHCDACVIDNTSSQMILFMKCATNLTIKRRDDIKSICGY